MVVALAAGGRDHGIEGLVLTGGVDAATRCLARLSLGGQYAQFGLQNQHRFKGRPGRIRQVAPAVGGFQLDLGNERPRIRAEKSVTCDLEVAGATRA